MDDFSRLPDQVAQQARGIHVRAQKALERHDLAGAIRFFCALSDLLEISEADFEQAQVLVQIASLKMKLQQDTEAIETYKRAFDLLQHTEEELGQAMVLNNLGHCYVKQRQFDFALRCFDTALEHYRRLQMDNGIVEQLHNVGSVHRDLRSYEVALNNYFGALSIYEKLSDEVGCADQFVNIGYIYAMQGNVGEALEWFNKAPQTFEANEEWMKAEATRKNIERLEGAANNSSVPIFRMAPG